MPAPGPGGHTARWGVVDGEDEPLGRRDAEQGDPQGHGGQFGHLAAHAVEEVVVGLEAVADP
jgi:hypothetical protein